MNDDHDNSITDLEMLRKTKAENPQQCAPGSLRYFHDLARDRDYEDKVSALPPAWQDLFNATLAGGPIVQKDVSKFIDLLKGCERKGRTPSVYPIVNDIPINTHLSGTAVDVNFHHASIVLEDGFYRSRKDGNIYKVYHTQKGQQVAKKLLVHHKGEEHAEVSFEYVGKRPLHSLGRDDRLTLAEAVEFGKLYGRCMICNRTLTNELSIALGIGPICGDREFGGEFRFMVRSMKGLPEGADKYMDVTDFDVQYDDQRPAKALDDMSIDELQARLAELKARTNQ